MYTNKTNRLHLPRAASLFDVLRTLASTLPHLPARVRERVENVHGSRWGEQCGAAASSVHRIITSLSMTSLIASYGHFQVRKQCRIRVGTLCAQFFLNFPGQNALFIYTIFSSSTDIFVGMWSRGMIPF